METSAVNLREYSRIFTGTNQETGYETPFFGFTTDTTDITFNKDKITYFHYPMIAPSELLVNSSLITDGAIAGENPFTSDKIWKKQANYSTNSIWGDSQPIGKQTGIWLCSWLSGNAVDTNSMPVWKDRWYNPGYIDPTTALFITTPLSSVVVDVDSVMSFDGGCYYKYFHVGDSHNNTIVNNLTAGNHLKLYIDDWSQYPEDLSQNNNTTRIQYFTNECVNYKGVNYIQRPDDTCLNMHMTNYCETLYSSAIALTGSISYNIWARSDDWTKGNNTIISKDNRGGYAIKVDQGFDNRYMMFLDDAGKMVLLNIEGHVIDSKTLPQPSNPTCLVMDYNHYTWVSDNSAKKVYKIDYNGDLLASIDFGVNVGLKSITLDDNKKLWVLDSNSNSMSSFDIFTNELVGYGPAFSGNAFTWDLTGSIWTTSGTQILVDNDNAIWSVESGIVNKNYSPVVSGTAIACDKDNNIWVTFGTNSYLKMNATTFDYVSGTVGNNTTPTDRAIDFTYELNLNNEWVQYSYFTFANEQKIYKTDTDGNFIKSIDLSIFDTYPNLSTFTSFDWNRKFNYIKYDRTPQLKADLFVNNSGDIEKYTLTTPVTGFNDQNWHMFTYTSDKNNLKLYMDGILRDSQSIGSDTSIYYTYENALMFGADTGKIEPLSKELGLGSNYFIGKVDALRIYDSVLNNFDIRHLYLNKYDFNDLMWNLPTGTQSYIEEIVRFFKFKLPGQKSQYYNINLIGLQITDENLRIIMENIIKDTIKKVAPAYAELYRIVWK